MPVTPAAATITRHRERMHWSKRRLARGSGLSPAYIVQMEKGDRPVTRRALAKVADAVGLHPYRLLTEGEFIPAADTAEAEQMAELALADPAKAAKARTDDIGGRKAWLAADYLMMLGHDAYGTDTEGPWIVAVDWSDLAPERWAAMQEGRAHSQSIAEWHREAQEWLARQEAAPIQLEGWDALTNTQKRLVQQLVNQLRDSNAEGGDHGDREA